MHLVGKAKPPDQVMRGSGFSISFEDRDRHFTYRMTRRVRKVSVGGVIKSRVEIVCYETTGAGMIYRIERDGTRHEIMPGDDMGESEWVAAALLYRHGMRYLPPNLRHTLKRPEDLVKLQDERTGHWIEADQWK